MKTLRIAFAVTVAAVASLLTLSAPAQADSDALQPFKADSGDSCRYGSTEGYLYWRYVSGSVLAVDVRGSLTDRPVTSQTIYCRDDHYYSVATFTAYYGRTIVDKEERLANNQKISFGFTLSSAAFNPRIDTVVVQVCRYPRYTPPVPAGYCGQAVAYRSAFVPAP